MPIVSEKSVNTYKQSPPFCIQIELVEGCSLRCTFCGLNGIRGKDNDYKFMKVGTLSNLYDQLNQAGWKPRVEFAMHGEPSVHPQLVRMLEITRRKLPKCHLMMTSNGAGFLKDPLIMDECLEYLNVLALDWYENVRTVPKILDRYDGEYEPIFYPEDKEGNPHKRRKLHQHELVVIKDIKEANTGTHSTLNNHAGCGAPKNDSAAGKKCAKPFREVSVRWEGSIAVCCNDWRGEYCCGNVCDTPISDIWHGSKFVAARHKLYHGMRDFGPCEGCDALSYRPGLLPDQKGLEELPRPSAIDREVINTVLKKPPLTEPVLRPWEEKL